MRDLAVAETTNWGAKTGEPRLFFLPWSQLRPRGENANNPQTGERHQTREERR